MNSNEWTLTGELCRITGTTCEAEALHALTIIPSPLTSYVLRSDSTWRRGGDETFIFRFWVSTKINQERGYIVKACVSLDIVRGIGSIINEWLQRRKILNSQGVSVPLLFYAGQGMIIEEMVPWKLRDYMADNRDEVLALLGPLVDYTACLSSLRFAPVDGFQDLMTHGSDVVVVDFGQDLGPPGVTRSFNLELFDAFLETVLRWQALPDVKLVDPLYRRYLKALREIPINSNAYET